MNSARIGKEIVVKVKNEIGVLHAMSKLLAEKGVNILALHGAVGDGNAVVRLVTTDNLRAGDVLRAKNFAPVEQECVLIDLPHKPGMLRGITEKLAAEDIDLTSVYATAGEMQDQCLVVLGCTRHDHAVVVLNR